MSNISLTALLKYDLACLPGSLSINKNLQFETLNNIPDCFKLNVDYLP